MGVLKHTTTAPAKDCQAGELRRRVREEPERAAAAMAELERRRDNLLGACIPAWELAARGPEPSQWDLVA